MLYIATDHGGFQLKKYLIRYLKTQLKTKAVDLGPKKYDKEDDYPDYAIPLARKVAQGKNNKGILICRMGNGTCIAANKVKGIRAAVAFNIDAAEYARRDNNANIICLSGDVVSNEHAAAIVKKFLESGFDGGRHARRMDKIAAIEK